MARRLALVAAAVVTAAAGSCGDSNYSNEDLEFLSALPMAGDLSVDLPMSTPYPPAELAELYVATHDAASDFNGYVAAFLGLIKDIRADRPTTRVADERILGPFAVAAHPGWSVQMVIDRDPQRASFSYRLDFRANGTLAQPGTSWLTLASGDWTAVPGVRKGAGHMNIVSQPLRDAGYDPGLGHLVELHVAYDTGQFPVTATLSFTSLPVDGHPEVPTAGQYTYGIQSDGRGVLTFDLWSNVLPGDKIEQLSVSSRWLGTGEGRADATVVAGDLGDPPASVQAECWDKQLRAVYDDKPWATATDLPSPGVAPGDAALCPAIQPL